MYADVLTEYSAKAIDQTFTYKVPERLLGKLKKGMKVLIPFGQTKINGFVTNIKDECSVDNLKEIINITDEAFTLNDELMSLGVYLKETCLCTQISAYQAMLPASMKVKTINTNYQQYDEYVSLNTDPKDYIEKHKTARKQIELLTDIQKRDLIPKTEVSSAIARILENEGLVKIIKKPKYRINAEKNEHNVTLTEEQQEVANKVINSKGKSETFLLYGITGSGKTEVYLNIIDNIIKEGKTALLLVPEISLTTQIIKRFYNHFGSSVAVFHSALSDGEKYDEYHKIMDKKVSVVVGTRSAIFTPLENIGVIIIDEEHSSNYKQENNPRYNAKDVALWRSKYHSCPVVLGSATPSLESMARAQKGVFTLLTLQNRIGKAKLPEITIVDMKEEYQKGNSTISETLDKEIKEALNNNKQVMLFLNRRGFNTFVTCRNCGYTYKCPNCDITLTYHKTSNNLRCHYCGYTLLYNGICPECKEKALTSLGLGTEKLEEEIKIKYPEAKVLRMDADTTTRKGSHEKYIQMIENGEVNIIVGTQMISKGLDFPNVTVVGVINADESLNIPDFRSGEYTYSLLSQVSGRAGRKNGDGKVILQTFNKDNETLNLVKQNNYKGLYTYEMNIRRELKYPPYFYITTIKIASKDYDEASKEATKACTYLRKNLENTYILGPTTARMFKVKNIYRFQIILKYKNFDKIKEALTQLDTIYKTNTKVNIEIDNNPCYI